MLTTEKFDPSMGRPRKRKAKLSLRHHIYSRSISSSALPHPNGAKRGLERPSSFCLEWATLGCAPSSTLLVHRGETGYLRRCCEEPASLRTHSHPKENCKEWEPKEKKSASLRDRQESGSPQRSKGGCILKISKPVLTVCGRRHLPTHVT